MTTLQRWLRRAGGAGAAVALLFAATSAFAGTEYVAGANESTVPGQLLVRFRAGSSATAVVQQFVPGATTSTVRQDANVQIVQLPQRAPLGVASQLAASPDVVYVEPNRVRQSQGLVPNDPQLNAQWALQNVQAMQAWGVAPDGFLSAAVAESGRIRVAVLDTGVDCTHPDFINAGGGSTDSAAGGQLNWSISKAYYPTTAGTSCSWGDDFGHGTHVAGIIAASANNGQGIAGVAYPVEILVYKVLNSSGSGDDGKISQAIVDAANNGAAVISLSLGAPGYSQTLQSAINYAWQKNALVVAAAGNSSSAELFFPAAANYALGVAATDVNDNLAGFSDYGFDVAVGAPGVGILSTVPTYANQSGATGYAQMSGTSMAAPHVSAAGGMIFAASPKISAAMARMLIEESADNGNPGGQAGQQLGYGRINLWRALSGNTRPSSAGGIVGQAVDANGNPISNSLITVAGQTQASMNGTGLFRFYGVPAGSYTAVVSAPGYVTRTFQVNVAGGADSSFTPVLGGTPAQFSGVVTDNGQPAAGAVVEALSGGLIQSTAVTGQGGVYTLYVQPGTYDLQTSGLFRLTTTLAGQSVGANGNTVANLSLPAMGRITGSVELPNGAPA
ncbi:MAG TPA: S8 family serine peptidase, partial [Bryobacteraceae bacterium]|nr:S8 family serine peptidase [Bryobacteraceae bacterium]